RLRSGSWAGAPAEPPARATTTPGRPTTGPAPGATDPRTNPGVATVAAATWSGDASQGSRDDAVGSAPSGFDDGGVGLVDTLHPIGARVGPVRTPLAVEQAATAHGGGRVAVPHRFEEGAHPRPRALVAKQVVPLHEDEPHLAGNGHGGRDRLLPRPVEPWRVHDRLIAPHQPLEQAHQPVDIERVGRALAVTATQGHQDLV